MSIHDLWQNASQRAKEKLIYQYFLDKYLNDPALIASSCEFAEDYEDFLIFTRESSGFTLPYALITVNPKPKTLIKEFHQKVKKSLRKIYIEHWLYAFEWRDTFKGEKKGLHVHMLVKINKHKKTSELKREFHSTFKYLVGDKRHIHINRSGCFKNFSRYIRGHKTKRHDKSDASRYDVNNRETLGLEAYYTNHIDFVTCAPYL